jgi:hypothetical protein
MKWAAAFNWNELLFVWAAARSRGLGIFNYDVLPGAYAPGFMLPPARAGSISLPAGAGFMQNIA